MTNTDHAILAQPQRQMVQVRGLWFKLLHRYLSGIKTGYLKLTMPDSSVLHYGDCGDALKAELHFHSAKGVRALVLGGANGFADAFLDGEWSSPDITALLTVAIRNEAALQLQIKGGFIKRVQRLGHLLHANTRAGSRRNISFHYDLGNEFYKTWLDGSMTYSSALFENETEALPIAQERKYRSLCETLDLKRGQRVLEIGCGWGGFSEVAARDFGVDVVAITLSKEQAAFARQRMQRSGLDDRVSIELIDYRDVEGQFDAIVSIEMIEAVGEQFLPGYFAVLNQRVKPGGKIALQAITMEESRFDAYRKSVDFIQRHVFPGGFLPSESMMDACAQQAGLMRENVRLFGQSYARTLADWRTRFEAAWDDIQQQGFDTRFRRLWNYYLSYCESGFATGRTNVGHYFYTKPE